MTYLKTLIACVAVCAGPALADPIEGLWKTSPDDHGDIGFIQMAQCGNTYCGKLVRAQNKAGQQITPNTIGRKIVWNVASSGQGAYSGRIYAPDRDKEYVSKLKLSGSTLKVSGCVMGGLLCREGGTWKKVN